MRFSPLLLGLALPCVFVASCHRESSASADELRRDVQKLNARIIQNTAAVAELDPLASEIARDCTALRDAITKARSETEELQRQAHELHSTMTVSNRTGVLPERIVPGARLESINAGGKLYRNVTVDSISSKGVLIRHADGIARLNPLDVLGHDIAPPSGIPSIPRYTISQASAPLSVASAAPISQPPRYLRRPATPAPSVRKPRAQEVEVLAWWGSGSPYTTQLRDSFGNPRTAVRPGGASTVDRPGPWAIGRRFVRGSSSSVHLKGHSSMKGYRPIGWNYRGSDLDFIYGRKP